ncbi:hypothetical protein OJF2_05580 [Aquisphaera giovannonii]|uniref:DUF3150 domain-containing protein n=1 Tax=Aquisphaera giovannonii TaxID=406548 RepID=A0A5B9VVB8_9BACT|nr:hypothetical protein [Aquisphaera giovannonii]QEH32089.1 hypothetical protein OJF2_05580 [Aquisphaera giovannonii]
MTTLLERIDSRPADDMAAPAVAGPEPAARLRATMAACRVQFTWFGTKRTLTAEQKAQAARAFDAEGHFLSAGKKLLDTKHSAFRAVTAIRTRATDHWRGLTLPFPEPGVRLIRHADVEDFDRRMADLREELEDAVVTLDRHFGELKEAASRRLGSLYCPSDYPATLVGLFGMAWDYPNVEPPAYLAGLAPGLYRQEQDRVKARFEEAVQLAERAFLDEFARLVGHLTERITGANGDGTPKVFRDSAVDNLCDFFERFRTLNVRSNGELDELVDRARQAVRGVAAADLRDSASARADVARQLSTVRESLDAMLVDRPRRRILRGSPAGGEA